ncbi:MAG: PqqD family protein [Ilumatobacteraceae bacterium]
MSARYRRSPAAIWRASERVLVAAVSPNPPTRMAGSAPLVWRHLAVGIELDELADRLSVETGSDPEVIRADVASLLDALIPLGLVERA